LSAGYKIDSIVQKGTELGVKRFVPILSEKSRVKLDDPRRAPARVRRLEKVALAAIKQCRRAYRPDLAAPVTLGQFLEEADPADVNLIFHPAVESRPLESCLSQNSAGRVTILVGPEAGFSSEEVRLATDAGFQLISLGRRVLRSETAAPVACALVMALLGELR
jgi:16S rRNA (uracil1498-N3)-methyltransferase